MTDKNAPKKISVTSFKGLSQKQLDRIRYECELLNCSVEALAYAAPFLFIEGITAANTISIQTLSSIDNLQKIEPEPQNENPQEPRYDYHGVYNEDYDDYSPD